MSTYSTNLAIELITTGTQAGVWGSTTNTNLGTLIEQAISGYTTYAVTGGTDTLAMTPGASATARNMYIELTGTGGGTLVVPANKKLYFIYNNSSASVTVKVSGQTGVAVPLGAKILLVCNGTDVVLATNYMISPTFSTPTLGTPASGTLTNCSGLPLATGISGFGTGVATFLATPSSANLASAVTDETGSGALVFANSPTLVTPALGTPSALVGTNITGTASGLSIGGSAATLTTGRTISLTGDVTATTGSFNGSGDVTGAATIANSAVTNAKIANAAVSAAKLDGAQSGSAPIYGARAWVYFVGDGSASANATINGSGNVSSVFKNSSGNYSINFATAMSDANYTFSSTGFNGGSGPYGTVLYNSGTTNSGTGANLTRSTSVLQVEAEGAAGYKPDPYRVDVIVLR